MVIQSLCTHNRRQLVCCLQCVMAAVCGQTSVWPGVHNRYSHPAYSCHLLPREGRFVCFSKPEFDSIFHVGVALPDNAVSPLSLRERARVRVGFWLFKFVPDNRNLPTRFSGCPSDVRSLVFGCRCQFSDRVWKPEFQVDALHRYRNHCRRLLSSANCVAAAVRGQASVWPVAYLSVFHPAYSCHLLSCGNDKGWLLSQVGVVMDKLISGLSQHTGR